MPAPGSIQRIYLMLLLGNTLAASLIWGINTIFLLDAGLSNLEAFAANAFFTAGMVLFEVPTGIVADTVGRRASYLLGTLTLTASTFLYVLLWEVGAPFWQWAVASMLLGLGFTFFSGAVEAWLVDALTATGFEGELETVFGRGQVVTGVAMLSGSVAGGFIAEQTSLGVPFVLRGAVLLLMFGVAFWAMHDIGFTPEQGGRPPAELREQLDLIGRDGGTPLAVCRDNHVLGVVHLEDVVKEGMRARFDELRAMGISTVMVTGDNRLTAAKIAEEAGVDDFLPEATPEQKLELIRGHQGEGRLVAMAGDGTNDAPALAQSDVGVAMNTGTQAAREAGNMVDLDSNPTKLIEIVEIGKQLLITRGALTTFSIANDVAKYFAILPAIFAFTYATDPGQRGPLDQLNVMSLGTPSSAILSAIVFNALVIPLLVPLALRGVRYRPIGATALLRRNMLVFGLGGLIVPFVGIKLLDLLIHNLLGA